MAERCINLRRPATLSFVDEPFVPDRALMDEIDDRWAHAIDVNPALFDGRLCHVIGVHRNGYSSAVLHVADCAYRFFAVQDDEFDLGVRPLGVKGLTTDGAQFLLGQRAAYVASYAHQWEFAPGGSVEPDRAPVDVIAAELYEETGLTLDAPPIALAVVYDNVLRCWELVYRMHVTRADAEPPTDEYADRRWCSLDDLPAPLTPIAQQLVPLARAQG
ncbi:MAG: NUDIX hydrolase [Planctomycetota bacterium]